MGEYSQSFRRAVLSALFLLLLPIESARAAFDEFSDTYAPRNFELRSEELTLAIKGEIELELHNIEGKGGPGYDSSTDTRTIGTRSPFVEIDAFWLALRLGISPNLSVNTSLDFTPRRAGVSAVWFDWTYTGPSWLRHHLEAGYHTPFVKIDRRTERYPLSGTIYWREPELHAVYEARFRPARRIAFETGLSAAMMRPITFSGVQESTSQETTINVVAYGPAAVFSGNAPVFGAKGHVECYGAFASIFGYIGRLSAESGTHELRNNFSHYQDLPGYNAEDPDIQDTTFRWAGARAGYEDHGLSVFAEGIYSRESLLRRYTLYGQASFAFRLRARERLVHTIEPIVRYEVYRLPDSTTVLESGDALRSTAPSQAVTWDYDILTAALLIQVYRDVLRLRLEYYWIKEINGVPELEIEDEPLLNDEFLAQIELRF